MSETNLPQLGQRWLSNAEVELGLGTVVSVDARVISLLFPATGESRNYAIKNAPISRIQFAEGDTAKHAEGWQFKVQSSSEQNGILNYVGIRIDNAETVQVKETFIAADFVLTAPQERLFNGHYDSPKWFDIRKQSIDLQQNHFSSEELGFLGARVQILPHQIHIAKEVGQRIAPRVLLADEVGLGKTIEAAMIVHQQLLSERAQRILIVVPDSLVNQWLVEMLRKFNLSFAIFDEERCESLSEEEVNPFETEQLVLCSLNFLTHNSRYYQQALACEWDLMVVDEAHHLHWSEGNPSQEYEVIEALAEITKGILLLTATPDQLGHESHFARLKLLDPNRFHDYQRFLVEEQNYSETAAAIAPLVNNEELKAADLDLISLQIPDVRERFQDVAENTEQRQSLISEMLDRHGTGRVLFRNSRASISGFPKRELHPVLLPEPEVYQEIYDDSHLKMRMTPELFYAGTEFWTELDPRVTWFINKLQELKGEKVLTICANAITALDLADNLRVKSGVRATVFHEGLSIVERDKAANYFAQSEDGAQVLITSEIGSEGRNFQFAHHLILFDLPLNPDLLEQRIGRLDRIGQRHDIQIHVPVFEDSAQQVLLDWYNKGLNAFEKTCPTGSTVYEEVKELLEEAIFNPLDSDVVSQLLSQTKILHEDLSQKLEQGRDRLLEINSSGHGRVESFIEKLEDADCSPTLERFMTKLFDTLGVMQQEKDDDCYLLTPTESMVNHIPGLQDEGMTITYERDVATTLEHVHFITWDHPLVHNAIDMLLSDVHGKSSLGFYNDKAIPAGFFWLECLYVVSAKGSRDLQLNRYFPKTPVQFTLDAKGTVGDKIFPLLDKVPKKVGKQLLKALDKGIKAGLAKSEVLAKQAMEKIVADKREQITKSLGSEIARLQELQLLNPSVRNEEIEDLQGQLSELLIAADNASIQLEAIRMVVNNP
ncbi:MAG: RNA polymerase-associated protein RapA [Alteromonadaceae bacterium]|nr:RNA polymerase-associated protein RapA [Alteromonadaceae bacterium]